MASLSAWERRQALSSLLKFLDSSSNLCKQLPLYSKHTRKDDAECKIVAGNAALLQGIFEHAASLQETIVDQLLSQPHHDLILRSATLALNDDSLQTLLERSWSNFGDKLHIKHKPIMQQESNVRALLLAAGKVHRTKPMEVFILARSSNHGNAISERLSSSSPRVRWLGMVVGTAISSLVDKRESRMEFGVDELKTDEAMAYISLVNIDDQMGTVKDLAEMSRAHRQNEKPNSKATNPPRGPKAQHPKAEVAKIVEIVDDDEADDDLVPYAKPDSDAEDSEEDATLVRRNKPKAPVYVLRHVSKAYRLNLLQLHQGSHFWH